MKAVFIGCVQFSQGIFAELHASGSVDIVGVITREQSGFHADFASLIEPARMHGIPVWIDRGNDQEGMLQWLREIAPDVIICVGWPYLLRTPILEMAPRGVIGYHPADVPHNRGRHPIIWALVLGLEETASTFFFMNEQPDAGGIIDKVRVPIGPTDDAATLYKRLLETARMQIVRIAKGLVANSLQVTAQDLRVGNVWRKRSKRDGCIDWRMSASTIQNLVRALARPYPGAHCEYQNSEIRIWKVKLASWSASNIEPGRVLQVGDVGFTVKCGEGAIEVLEHEFAELPRAGEYL